MKSCADIHDPKKMNPLDFDDPLIFLQCYHEVDVFRLLEKQF